MKQIRVLIRTDGTCTIDAIQFVGPACQAATQAIAEALGGRVAHQQAKPEARLRERTAQESPECAR